jgi:hypothetical protein
MDKISVRAVHAKGTEAMVGDTIKNDYYYEFYKKACALKRGEELHCDEDRKDHISKIWFCPRDGMFEVLNKYGEVQWTIKSNTYTVTHT